jgi:hypothetical protein
VSSSGRRINAWNAISVLQFHAYELTAESVLAKVDRWIQTWKSDLVPIGRKTLAITEVAVVGLVYPATPSSDQQAIAFMTTLIAGLLQRPQVSHVSWFSSSSFGSFSVPGYTPAPGEMWYSNLFDTETGEATAIGMAWMQLAASLPPSLTIGVKSNS